MALPVVRAVGTVASGTAGITPGMPTGVLTGDILLLVLETQAQAITVSGGTETWAEVTDSPQDATSTRLTVFWTRASQNTPTSPTTSDSGDHQIGRMIAVSGCIATGNPWDVTSGGVDNTTTNTSISVTGDTTTVVNCLVCVMWSSGNDSATFASTTYTNANLANITERINNSTATAGGGGIGLVTGEKATVGAYTSTTVDFNEQIVTSGFMTVALKPPVASAVNSNHLLFF